MQTASAAATFKPRSNHDDRTVFMVGTHQTIKLSRGKHSSPDHGACVMELASMLGGEPFSDHPASVCPVIGVLLRTYNDALDDGGRQELYAYAAKAVGSRGSRDVERARADRLTAWALEIDRHRAGGSTWFRLLNRLTPKQPVQVAAARAIQTIVMDPSRGNHEVLEFVDELLGVGSPPPPPPPPSLPAERNTVSDGRTELSTATD
jgi:hypothetical protein